MKKTYIFGNNYLSEIVWYYLTQDGTNVDGFVLNKQYVSQNTYPLPAKLYAIEDVIEEYGAGNIDVYLTIGYTQMNDVREKVYTQLKEAGVNICSYIHPTAYIAKNVCIGEGCIVLENVILQPYVSVGTCNILWQGVNISHHSVMKDYNYLAPIVSIAGCCGIGNNCFFGINATLIDHINVEDYCFVNGGVRCPRFKEKYCCGS